MIKVRVTKKDIAEGIAGDCHECAVALALTRATKDQEPMVYQRDWTTYLKVWSRSIRPPYEVVNFIHQFDAQPRTKDGRLDTAHPDFEAPKPFRFELPDQDDPEWEEGCCGCECLFAPSELDDEGCCEECREEA